MTHLVLADWARNRKTMIKKIIALLILVSSFYFVGATGVLASNNISVTVKTYAGNSTPAVSTPFDNQARGNQVSITHGNANANGFAFFAVNDTIRPDLSIDHQFKVLSRMSISVIYDVRDNGNVTEHAVVFVDSNRKIIEVQYVAVGQLAVTPSSLPTPPPNMDWKETPWLTADNKSLADVVDSNRIYYAQYELVDTVSSYQLTVVGGTGSGSYAYNSVATITPNAAPEGKVFSHWADAEGNKLSYKSSYKVSILAATSVQAVFVDGATSPAEQPVVSMSDDLGIKGSQFVTYKGQMQLPAGYSIVEYGFIFSRSSDVLTLTSLGATIVPSNIHYGVTGEFMRSFPADTFNSIRAYMIVQNGSNPDEVVYSENYVKLLSTTASYSTGFESIDPSPKTAYAAGEVTYESVVWNMSDALIGNLANDRKNGLFSARIQSSGFIETKTLQYGITNISFLTAKYGTDSNAKIYVAVSSNGTDWIDVTDAINASGVDVTSTTLTPVSIDLLDSSEYVLSGLSSSLGLYVKISKTGGTRINIDDVVISMKSYPNLHEVIYNNATPSSENVLDGQTISNTAPTQTGYSFAGWYIDAALTQSYNVSSPVVQSLQLYAKWTINQYTITFDSADGSAVDAISQDYNSEIDAPADPTREGYTFNGWSQAVPSVMPAVNLTLTAQWLINTYTITFNSNEGSAVSPITQNFGSNVSAPAIPTREGYLFQGWFIDDVSFENEFVFTTMPSQNITLFAKWEELVGTYYTVTFDSLGGTTVTSQQVIENGYAELPNAPTKTGYTFVNWQNEENLVWAFETDEIKNNMTLYATWSLVSYSITYTNLENTTHSNPGTYNIETSTITLTPPSSRSGFNFSGWFTALEGGSQVTRIELGSTGNVTLFARWIDNTPVPVLLYSYNFLDGGTSNNNAYASTNLSTDVSYAADNPSGTVGTTSWVASYANLSLSDGTRLGGKQVSTENGANDASANIRTDFTFEQVITKVEIIGATTFGTVSNLGNIYLQTSSDGNTWTTVGTQTVSSTISYLDLNINAGLYLRVVIQLAASTKNSGLQFTGIKVTGYPS